MIQIGETDSEIALCTKLSVEKIEKLRISCKEKICICIIYPKTRPKKASLETGGSIFYEKIFPLLSIL